MHVITRQFWNILFHTQLSWHTFWPNTVSVLPVQSFVLHAPSIPTKKSVHLLRWVNDNLGLEVLDMLYPMQMQEYVCWLDRLYHNLGLKVSDIHFIPCECSKVYVTDKPCYWDQMQGIYMLYMSHSTEYVSCSWTQHELENWT